MSSTQKYERRTVKLNQVQSAVLDSLKGWTPAGKTINYTKKDGTPGSFYKKYQEKPLDDSTLGAVNIFAELGLSTYDKAESFSGVFVYTIGKDTLEKEEKYVPKSKPKEPTPSTGTSKSYDSEGAKKGHEENVQMHKEFLAKMDDVIFSLGAVKDALEIVATKLERVR